MEKSAIFSIIGIISYEIRFCQKLESLQFENDITEIID